MQIIAADMRKRFGRRGGAYARIVEETSTVNRIAVIVRYGLRIIIAVIQFQNLTPLLRLGHVGIHTTPVEINRHVVQIEKVVAVGRENGIGNPPLRGAGMITPAA